MSFARKIRSTIAKEEGRALPSIIPHIEKQVVEAPKTLFSKESLLEETENFRRLLSEDCSEDEMRDAFSKLYDSMYAPVPRRSGVVSPSKFYDACLRSMYYSATKTPITDANAGRPSAGLQMIFDTGSWWHTYIQNHLHRSGVLVQSEVNVTSLRYGVAGSADGIVELNGERYLLEIKTINSYGFAKLSTKPQEQHIYQASIYASLLKLDKIIFLYIDKNTSRLLEFIIDVDKEVVEKFQNKALKLKDDVRNKLVPSRECVDKFTPLALSCKFCTHCFKDKD